MAKFINQGLVASASFAPKDTPDPEPAAGAPHPSRPAAPLENLLRREDEAVKKSVTIQEWEELARRRAELLAETREILVELEEAARHAGERLQALQSCRGELERLDLSAPAETVTSAILRQAKHKIHAAHIELLKTARSAAAASLERGPVPGGASEHRRPAATGLGFWWPLVVALLAAALIIVAGMFMVFRQGL